MSEHVYFLQLTWSSQPPSCLEYMISLCCIYWICSFALVSALVVQGWRTCFLLSTRSAPVFWRAFRNKAVVIHCTYSLSLPLLCPPCGFYLALIYVKKGSKLTVCAAHCTAVLLSGKLLLFNRNSFSSLSNARPSLREQSLNPNRYTRVHKEYSALLFS